MKRFVCRRLRMLNYLLDAGFKPYAIEPSYKNPKHKVFLFEETPELNAAVIRYFSTDCYTAQIKHQKEQNNHVNLEEKQPKDI